MRNSIYRAHFEQYNVYPYVLQAKPHNVFTNAECARYNYVGHGGGVGYRIQRCVCQFSQQLN